MKLALSSLIATPSLLASPGDLASQTNSASHEATLFFANMRKLCDGRFEGATEFPPDADHPLAGKKLLISIERCSETEIRIPLHAGEDKSRTWILTLTADGLLLKHDHRHADGTPDEITNYGGFARPDGTATRQSFAADAATAKLIPEAETNVWTLEIDEAKRQLSYALERNRAPRYKAVFQLAPAP